MTLVLKNLKNFNIIFKSCYNDNNLKYLYTRTFININKNKRNFFTSSFIKAAKSSIKNENVKKIKKTEIRRLLSMAKPEKNKLASTFISFTN